MKPGTITSCPGPTPAAAIAHSSAEVPLLTPRAYFVPKNLAASASNFCASCCRSGPYSLNGDFARTTLVTASTSSLSYIRAPGQCSGKGLVRTGVPPSMASLSLIRAILLSDLGLHYGCSRRTGRMGLVAAVRDVIPMDLVDDSCG